MLKNSTIFFYIKFLKKSKECFKKIVWSLLQILAPHQIFIRYQEKFPTKGIVNVAFSHNSSRQVTSKKKRCLSCSRRYASQTRDIL